jgi:hypothetical protein
VGLGCSAQRSAAAVLLRVPPPCKRRTAEMHVLCCGARALRAAWRAGGGASLRAARAARVCSCGGGLRCRGSAVPPHARRTDGRMTLLAAAARAQRGCAKDTPRLQLLLLRVACAVQQ